MYSKDVVVPESVKIEIEGNKVKVFGEKGILEKTFKATFGVKMEKQESKVKVSSESERRKVKALVGAIAAHIRNMINGVTKGYIYRLRVIYSHFPITVKVEGSKVMISNFLGERVPRVAKIFGEVKVKIEGQDIIVTGIDIDDVGLTAGSIEQSTRVTARDRKVFQDGAWIVSRD
ncbi:MAG TPA: 50S ribosomal protein L6 [archaeon]|nr:50S ribosomal protein L6 [archaeon]